MKKRLLSALLAFATISSLMITGCGKETASSSSAASSSTASNSASGSTASTEELVVNIWDNNQLAGLQKIADKWTEKSGIKVRIDVITWTEYWTLLEAGASGGELPDVFWMHINEAQKYMEADMLLNLDDYIANDDSIDLANYYEGINAIYSNNGSQYALPKDHDTIAMIYNKSIFDKYNLEYPTDDWTWEQYAETAKKITELGKDEGIYGTAMNTNDGQDGWYNFIYDWGGAIISDDNKTSMMDDENTVAGLTWLADNLFPCMPSQGTMSESDPDNLFLSGKIGMMLQGSWMVNTFYSSENAADYAWAEIPYNDANNNGTADDGERCSMYNGLGWAAAYNTEDPQAAYDLIAYFASEEGQLMQSELGVTMAAYKGCSDSFPSAFDGMDISAFLKVEENGTLIQHPASRLTTVWEGGFTTGFIGAWQEPSTMADTCLEMAAMMNEVLASE